MLQEISKFLANPINLVVLGWLGLYLFFVFFIFFYKYFSLTSWIKKEERALEALLNTNMFSLKSSLKPCIENAKVVNKYTFDACIQAVKKKSTTGLTFLSIVASTAPFIGLFGTVWGIMASFHDIGLRGSASLAVVAPGISEALVATAAGLAVAIPAVIAYNFYANRLIEIENEMQNFSTDFLNLVERDLLSRV